MSFIDKYYAIFNNSVVQHDVTISRAEFANLLGVFSKQEQQLEAYKMEAEEGKEINAELKAENEELKKKLAFLMCSPSCYKYQQAELFKQTLIEIKEITRKTLWYYPNLDDVTKCNMFDKILQKISEVGDGFHS